MGSQTHCITEHLNIGCDLNKLTIQRKEIIGTPNSEMHRVKSELFPAMFTLDLSHSLQHSRMSPLLEHGCKLIEFGKMISSFPPTSLQQYFQSHVFF